MNLQKNVMKFKSKEKTKKKRKPPTYTNVGGFILKDNLFQKIEQKTNISKETIINLANKLQKSDMKKEESIRDIIKEISTLTGKEVTREKEDKIIEAIKNDKVPKNIDNMF